jgi:hypothetical protein
MPAGFDPNFSFNEQLWYYYSTNRGKIRSRYNDLTRKFLAYNDGEENPHAFLRKPLYGDNVFEKDGIRRDRTGDGEKTRCLCGKRGIFNRDGPAMGPQIIRQLE